MEIILTKNDELCNEAASGLTALSEQLKISVPICDTTKINMKQKFDESEVHISQENIDNGRVVTFIAGRIDSNDNVTSIYSNSTANNIMESQEYTTTNRVQFNEDVLIQFSDVFSKMLNSDFKESQNKEIVLQRQTLAGIKYFLHSIMQKWSGDMLHVPENELIGAVLETYDMCQIYMLPELEKDVMNVILYMINATTALRIFEFSMAEHKQELSEITINYYLCANIPGPLKVQMYRAADNSEYCKEWNQMMLDSVVYTCQNLIISQ